MKSIISIANRARLICEYFANSDESIGYDFHLDSSLCCMCAIASNFLSEILFLHHIPNRVILGEYKDSPILFNVSPPEINHCWIDLIEEKKIIDITGTQFSAIQSPVFITDYHDTRFNQMLIKDSMDIFQEWPDEQRPSDEVTNRLISLYHTFPLL